jgi:hypothetical protein
MPLTGRSAKMKPHSQTKGKAMSDTVRRQIPWQLLGWGGAVLLLLVPFVAMRFTSEVSWSPGDFIFMGALFAIIGGMLELAVHASTSRSYRGGVILALLATFLVTWVNLAVGIVGSEDNPPNVLFFGALLVGIFWACLARFRAAGMAQAAIATAAALAVAFLIAITQASDVPFVPHIREAIGTGLFAALFLASAALFRKAARSGA